MTTTAASGAANNAPEAYAEHCRRVTPTYAGPSELEVQARLRGLGRCVEMTASSLRHRDVERARDAARLAVDELAKVLDALEQAMPAVELSADAAEARRLNHPWQPVQGVVDGPPITDDTWTDPVVVAAGDLAAMTTGWGYGVSPVPPGAVRACAQLVRQQPRRVTDLLTAAGRAWPQLRGALLSAGVLPEELP